MVLAFAPHFELDNFLSRLLRVASKFNRVMSPETVFAVSYNVMCIEVICKVDCILLFQIP